MAEGDNTDIQFLVMEPDHHNYAEVESAPSEAVTVPEQLEEVVVMTKSLEEIAQVGQMVQLQLGGDTGISGQVVRTGQQIDPETNEVMQVMHVLPSHKPEISEVSTAEDEPTYHVLEPPPLELQEAESLESEQQEAIVDDLDSMETQQVSDHQTISELESHIHTLIGTQVSESMGPHVIVQQTVPQRVTSILDPQRAFTVLTGNVQAVMQQVPEELNLGHKEQSQEITVTPTWVTLFKECIDPYHGYVMSFEEAKQLVSVYSDATASYFASSTSSKDFGRPRKYIDTISHCSMLIKNN